MGSLQCPDPGIRNPASDHLAGQHPVQQPFVLLILCILCIDVQKNDPRCRSGDFSTASGVAWRLSSKGG